MLAYRVPLDPRADGRYAHTCWLRAVGSVRLRGSIAISRLEFGRGTLGRLTPIPEWIMAPNVSMDRSYLLIQQVSMRFPQPGRLGRYDCVSESCESVHFIDKSGAQMPESSWPDWIRKAAVTRRAGGATPRPKLAESPYFGVNDENERLNITRDLVAAHPLAGPDITETVLRSWSSIFESRLGSGFHIGREIKPQPQIMGFLLHALIPLELAKYHSGWRAELDSHDKDLVYIPDEQFSIEIKTSSHDKQVFGNRSFGVENLTGRGKKAKDGYYLAVNFEPWPRENDSLPTIRLIRFGWLDHTDWVAQTAQTGQQSALPSVVDNTQFLVLYDGHSEQDIPSSF